MNGFTLPISLRSLDRRSLVTILVLLAAVSGCNTAPATSCNAGLSLDRAQQIARDLATSGQSSGTTIESLSSQLYVGQPHADSAWTIQVDAVGVYPQPSQVGGTARLALHWLIDVDKCTGRATIIGRG